MARRNFRRGRVSRRRPTRQRRVKRLVDGRDTEPKFMKILRTGASVASAVPAIAKGLSTVMSLINVEKNYFDTNDAAQVVGSGIVTPYFTSLTDIPEGDDVQTRTGRSILLQDLQVRIQYTSTTASGTPPTVFARILVWCDKNYDSTNAESAATILGKMLEDTGALQITQSPLNRDNSERFVLIKDKTIMLTQNFPVKTIRLYTRLGFHCFYNGTGPGNQVGGQLFMAVISGNQVDTDTIDVFARVNYTDN